MAPGGHQPLRIMSPAPETPSQATAPPHQFTLPRVAASLLILAAIFSVAALEGPSRPIQPGEAALRFLARMMPPDFSTAPAIGHALLETAQIALVGTAAALAAALPLAFCAARTLVPRPVALATRFFLNLLRTLPALVWAVLAVVVLGANAMAGAVALTFYSVGYLGKFFSDALESTDMDCARALRAGGASLLQAFQFGVWPALRPLFASYSLWMLEYNMRSATIIGYVGAGGLGLHLHTYQEFGQWNRFSAVLLCILGIVCALDLLAERVRQALAPGKRI